jgi:hypothetical protein
VGFCEHGNELSGSMEAENFFDWPSFHEVYVEDPLNLTVLK